MTDTHTDPEQLDELLARLDRAADDHAVVLLEELLRSLAALSVNGDETWLTRYPHWLRWQSKLAMRYARYVREQEWLAAKELLGGTQGGGLSLAQAGEFAQRTYARVADMFTHVDFSGCRRFVMVGSGPLPATLLHVLDRTPVAKAIGLDVDTEAIDIARQLARSFAIPGLEILQEDGGSYDYAAADVVYIANLVVPKAKVLRRVSETARIGIQVVLRDPFALGCLLADTGLDTLDSCYEVWGQGRGDSRFLTRDVFLRLGAPGAGIKEP
jgi:hypothetical protein